MLVTVPYMKTSEPLVDIFGIAMRVTPKARLREFHSYYAQLFNLGKLNLLVPIADLLYFVENGYLSPQSASYFLAGRASEKQSYALALFQGFEELSRSYGLKPFKILQSWQKTKVGKVENTFLFPLAELASNDSFEAETAPYRNQDVKDLQKL